MILLDLVDQDHRVAHDDAGQRDEPEHRHEAERRAGHQQRRRDTPISPSGAVNSTIATRLKLCNCTISSDSMTSTISGITALTEALPFAALLDGARGLDPVARGQRCLDRRERRQDLRRHVRRLRPIGDIAAHRSATACGCGDTSDRLLQRRSGSCATCDSGTVRPVRGADVAICDRSPRSCRSRASARATTGIRSVPSRYLRDGRSPAAASAASSRRPRSRAPATAPCPGRPAHRTDLATDCPSCR